MPELGGVVGEEEPSQEARACFVVRISIDIRTVSADLDEPVFDVLPAPQFLQEHVMRGACNAAFFPVMVGMRERGRSNPVVIQHDASDAGWWSSRVRREIEIGSFLGFLSRGIESGIALIFFWRCVFISALWLPSVFFFCFREESQSTALCE